MVFFFGGEYTKSSFFFFLEEKEEEEEGFIRRKCSFRSFSLPFIFGIFWISEWKTIDIKNVTGIEWAVRFAVMSGAYTEMGNSWSSVPCSTLVY